MNTALAEITQNILERKKANEALVVGINGIDTSGKTSFTMMLKQRLEARGKQVLVVHGLDFNNPVEYRESSADELENYMNRTISFRRMIHEVLEPIKKHGYINREVLLLDIGRNQYSNIKKFVADAESIVLVESVFLFKAELNRYLDYKIYLRITYDEMMKRVPRHNLYHLNTRGYSYENMLERCLMAQKKYHEVDKPREVADITVNTMDLSNMIIEKKELY